MIVMDVSREENQCQGAIVSLANLERRIPPALRIRCEYGEFSL